MRLALRLCTDRQALVDGLWGGKAHLPLAHQFDEYGEPYFIDGLELIRFDPEEGKRLLAEAGYNGEPILAQFPRSYYLYGDLAAQVIQQQWAKCGVKLELQEVDSINYDEMNVRAWSNPMYYPDPLGAMDTHWSEQSTQLTSMSAKRRIASCLNLLNSSLAGSCSMSRTNFMRCVKAFPSTFQSPIAPTCCHYGQVR